MLRFDRAFAAAAIVNTITYQWYKWNRHTWWQQLANTLFQKVIEGMYTIRAFDGKNCELSNTFNYNQDIGYYYKC